MPRIVDHDERRRQICDCLLDLVSEVGIPGATIRGIAQRTGWSTGVIGHYFQNRKDLLVGGLRRAAELLSTHNTRVLSSLNGIAALEQILECSIPLDVRRVAVCRIFFFFYIEAMHEPDLLTEVQTYLLDWRKAVGRAIRQAQTAGDLPAELDPRIIAVDLIGLAEGVSIHALLDEGIMQSVRERSPVRYWIRQLGDPTLRSQAGMKFDILARVPQT